MIQYSISLIVLFFNLCYCCWVTSVVSNSLQPLGLQPTSLLYPWNLQARILECVAIPLSRQSFWPRDRTWVSSIAGRFFIVWAIRLMGFFRQEYWSGLSFPPPGDLPNPGIDSTSLTSFALAGRAFSVFFCFLFFLLLEKMLMMSLLLIQLGWGV